MEDKIYFEVNNPHNHHPDCPFKNVDVCFASCGCHKVWDRVKALEAEIFELRGKGE